MLTILLKTGVGWGWGLGVGRVWVMGGGSLNSFLFSFYQFFFHFPFPFLFFPFPFPFFLRCGFLLQIPHIQQTSLYTKNKNSPEYGDFNLSWSGLQLLQNLKPIRLLFCTDSFCIHIYLYLNYIPYYYQEI